MNLETSGNLTDDTLVSVYCKGDVSALETLLDRHQAALMRYLRTMVSDPAEAEDVFQETWFRVIRAAKKYRAGHFRAWVFRMARNAVIDRARDRKRWVTIDGASDEDTPPPFTPTDRDPDPSQDLRNRELEQCLKQEIRKLPEAQQEVLRLRMEAGLSFKEIAEVQGVSINTVLGRMHYAVTRLRQVAGEE